MMKLEDTQKTTNDSLDATMHSFEGATRVTKKIANQIADYSKHSIEQGSKTMKKGFCRKGDASKVIDLMDAVPALAISARASARASMLMARR